MRIPSLRKCLAAVLAVALWVPVSGAAEESAAPPDSSCAWGLPDPDARLWRDNPAEGDPAMDLWVDSVPFGAEVRLGREILGITPLRINRASLSRGPLEISLPGFRPVVVGEDLPDTGVLDVCLLEPAGSLPGSDGRPARFGRRSLECGLVLLGSGSAVLGFHFKRTANEAYDEYLQTGNDRKMRAQFERAERYDRAALGCWVAAEVSLIGFLYLLMDSPEAEAWSLRPQMDGTGDECGVKLELKF